MTLMMRASTKWWRSLPGRGLAILTVLVAALVITTSGHAQTQPSAAAHQTDEVPTDPAHGTVPDHGTAQEHGDHGAAPHFDGGDLGLLWALPFAGILLSIALFPLLAPEFWHHHFGKVAGFWALAFLIPFTVTYGTDVAAYELLHTALTEYIPFIILLLSLFTVAGGVRLRGQLTGSPAVNTLMLFLGTVVASWTGTTGAAMLFIRPLIAANEWRRYRVHTFVFFIFLVANIGGSLTPLGDPPLFLGFLKGVSFFWPTKHMLLPMLLVASLLLVLYFVVDSVLYRKETGSPPATGDESLSLHGTANILLLGGVVAGVLLSGMWESGISVTIYHVTLQLESLARDVILLAMAGLSLVITHADHRRANAFTWFPIIEVAKLFAGIFVTIIPAIAILRAGTDGALGGVVSLVSDGNGNPVNVMYFWLTGVLSSFLDNAPTYLVFFNTAGGDAETLMGPLANTLLAISAGAVFMGANTYIGNAPNFMVRSICVERGIPMPSFFGYMVWSGGILLPVFALVSVVFFL